MFGNASGIEMMLKSMGLGTVLDAAKELAESGAVQKIITFSDGLEELNGRLKRIEEKLGIETPGAQVVAALEFRSAGAEPAPAAGVGGGS